MKAYVGVDGGGSQTRFLAVDKNGVEVAQLILNQGSKPNHYGVETTLRVVNDGLKHLQTQLESNGYSIASIYAGIAGCASPDSLYQPVVDMLHSYCETAELGGDIKTNFRAASDNDSGVIMLAGTGSAIANFYSSGRWTVLGSACHGAKDVLFEIIMRYQRNGWSQSFAKLLEAKLSQTKLSQSENDILTSQIDAAALRDLNFDEISNAHWQEYKQLVDRVADRWIYKGLGRIDAQLKRYPNETVDVVLSGGLWAFSYLRDTVTAGLKRNVNDSITVHYQPERTAVQGAAILAREL